MLFLEDRYLVVIRGLSKCNDPESDDGGSLATGKVRSKLSTEAKKIHITQSFCEGVRSVCFTS